MTWTTIDSDPYLKPSIHRILIRRLAFTAVIISVVLGGAVYLNEGRTVNVRIKDRAVQGVERFSAYASDLLDQPGLPDHRGIQNELEAFSAVQMIERTGVFVFVKIADTRGREVARLFHKAYQDTFAVREMIDNSHGKVPALLETDGYWEQSKWIRGVPYVLVAVPMSNSRGEMVATLEGVYAVSAEIIADARRRVLRTTLIVIGIVLTTTALLYPMVVTLMRRLSRMTYNLLDANLETLRVLGSAIAKRDSDTDAHNYRVTIMSVRLAEDVGLERKDMQRLIKGAFLHDVGKIGVRDNVLLKPGPLSDEEFGAMKTHVAHGVDIVSRSDWLNDATDVVGFHHEKFDGTGYGKGLSGTAIPASARIFAIADVFDALTSKRPYKEPFALEEALDVLEKGRGSHFDPDLLDAFKTIARDLHIELADRDDDGLRDELDMILARYFGRDVEVLI